MKKLSSFLGLVLCPLWLFSQSTFSLKQCVETAYTNNLQVKQSNVQMQTAGANYNQAKNNKLPTVSGNYNFGINNGRSIDPFTNAYITRPGDVQQGGYIPVSINLKSFAGQTVRIRVSEVDNLHGLVVGVDQVSATHVPVATCAPVRPRDGGASCNLDIDGDGLLTVTDALIATRYLLGLRGATLARGISFDACATNTSVAGLNTAATVLATGATPSPLDIDGDGVAPATTDGTLLIRAMLGLTGTAATTGVTAAASGASRSTWSDARTYLNSACLAGLL